MQNGIEPATGRESKNIHLHPLFHRASEGFTIVAKRGEMFDNVGVSTLIGVNKQDKFMKPAAFKATPRLDADASRALLKVVGRVNLSEKRRSELASYAEAARQAFARPLPIKMNGR